MSNTAYIQTNLQIQARTASLYKAKVYKALQSQVKAFTSDLKYGGVTYARQRLGKHDYNSKIGPVIMELYKTAAIATANRTASMLNKHLGVNKAGNIIEMTLKYRTMGNNPKWTADILAYFKHHLLEKSVKPISNTTRNHILTVLEKSITQGWSVDKTVKELEVDEITYRRAQNIVRTETTRAVNYGSMMAAYHNDYEIEKTWNEVKDKRTRTSHRHGSGVGGQKIPLLDRFSNGLLFPGDPDGGAAEVCNCRCVLSYSPIRDANGRLVPKKKAPVSTTSSDIQVEEDAPIVHVLSTHRTLAQELTDLAIQSGLLGAVNKLITDQLN